MSLSSFARQLVKKIDDFVITLNKNGVDADIIAGLVSLGMSAKKFAGAVTNDEGRTEFTPEELATLREVQAELLALATTSGTTAYVSLAFGTGGAATVGAGLGVASVTLVFGTSIGVGSGWLVTKAIIELNDVGLVFLERDYDLRDLVPRAPSKPTEVFASLLDDTIHSSHFDIHLALNSGDDTVYMAGGSDVILGGIGEDTVNYESFGAGITTTLMNATVETYIGTILRERLGLPPTTTDIDIVKVEHAGGVDGLHSIELIVGTNYNDNFLVGNGIRFSGWGGHDTFIIREHGAEITGDAGNDTIKAEDGLALNLSFDHAIVGVENFIGSGMADNVFINYSIRTYGPQQDVAANINVTLGAGDDIFKFASPYDDYISLNIDGGADVDTVDFSAIEFYAVHIDIGGSDSKINLTDVEHIIGTKRGDIFRFSGDGAQVATLRSIIGGEGKDTVDYSAIERDEQDNIVTSNISVLWFGFNQTSYITDQYQSEHTLISVEKVLGTQHGDHIVISDVGKESDTPTAEFHLELRGPSSLALNQASFQAQAAPAAEPNTQPLFKSEYDTVDYSSLSHGIDSFNGLSRATELDITALNRGDQFEALLLTAELGENMVANEADTAAIKATGVERLILTDHDDVHYFRGDSSIFSEFGRIEGRGGDDTILAYDPGYRLAGQLINPNASAPEEGEPDLRQRAGEDLFLEIDGGDGDDNLFVVGGAGARVVGGAGQDLIFSWSERSLVWGNEVDTAANQTSQEQSDMFWWSPGAFVQDADPVDFVSVFGITLTGGSNLLTKFGQTGGNQVIDSLMWFMGYSSTNSGQLLIHYLKPDLETLSNVMLIEDYDYAGDLGGSADEVFGIVQGGIANGKGDLGLRFRVWKADDGVEISLFNAMWGEIVFWLGQFDTFVKGLNWRSGKDPLVLDLDGDGLETVRMSQSQANFDFDDDFFAERTGWVDSDDGLLAVDRNADGVIDDISELFGGNNPDGIEQTGFAALSDFDSNLDGVVDASDADFDQLLVWRDLDGDGKGESGDADGFGNELFTLEELGISSISTGSTAFDASELVLRSNNSLSGGQRIGVEGHGSGVSTGDTEGGRIIASGATLLSEGSYTRTDGSTGAVYEVIFETDTTRTIYRGNTSLASWNPAIAAGSETGTAINATGRGRSTDLAISAANDPLLSAVIAAQLSQMGVAAGEAPDLATLRDLAA